MSKDVEIFWVYFLNIKSLVGSNSLSILLNTFASSDLHSLPKEKIKKFPLMIIARSVSKLLWNVHQNAGWCARLCNLVAECLQEKQHFIFL